MFNIINVTTIISESCNFGGTPGICDPGYPGIRFLRKVKGFRIPGVPRTVGFTEHESTWEFFRSA
eukprot:UN05489